MSLKLATHRLVSARRLGHPLTLHTHYPLARDTRPRLTSKWQPPALRPDLPAAFSSSAHSVAPLFVSITAVRPTAVSMDSSPQLPVDKVWPLSDDTRTPLVLVSCGSFSPITYLHLRMFEMCKDWIKENTNFDVVAGYLSPVSDAYKKQGLANAHHRIEMCQLAAAESSWIMVDEWEAVKPEYTRTALVLDHFQHEFNDVHGGVTSPSGAKVPARIALMSGADLIQTMSVPGVWAEEDLDHILGRYGAFIVERSGTDLAKALEALQPWKDQIYPIPQLIQNDVSSTKIRNFLRKDMSIRYLIPEPALKYIDRHNLFKDEAPAAESEKQKSPDPPAPTNGSIVNGA